MYKAVAIPQNVVNQAEQLFAHQFVIKGQKILETGRVAVSFGSDPGGLGASRPSRIFLSTGPVEERPAWEGSKFSCEEALASEIGKGFPASCP